jgi:hypothetical protein
MSTAEQETQPCKPCKPGKPHHRHSDCWPNDNDYLDGRTEIDLSSEQLLEAYWDTDIKDVDGVRPNRIINNKDAFTVRFRIELCGKLWRCIAGTWKFDLGFTPIGKGAGFDLSDELDPGALDFPNWRGCDPKALCINFPVTVPAGKISAEERDGTVYEIAAKFQLHCCELGAAVVGFEPLEEYQFYAAEV